MDPSDTELFKKSRLQASGYSLKVIYRNLNLGGEGWGGIVKCLGGGVNMREAHIYINKHLK